MRTDNPIADAQVYLNRERCTPTYHVCAVGHYHTFNEGGGWYCKDTNNHYCDDCVARGLHQEFYMFGNLSDYQITTIHLSFIKS